MAHYCGWKKGNCKYKKMVKCDCCGKELEQLEGKHKIAVQLEDKGE